MAEDDRPRPRALAALLMALVVAGCGAGEPTAAEQAARDARDVAEIEAIQKQKPPPQPLLPQAIRFDDIQQHRLFGPGCAFAPGGAMGAVLMAQDKAGYMKIRGRMVRIASDPGSTSLPGGAWSRYVGKDMAISLTRLSGESAANGEDGLRWSGRLTVTDPFDQIVYDEDGQVECRA